jgi:outer membrane protein OmpA-like peptidoglycan-associated protein
MRSAWRHLPFTAALGMAAASALLVAGSARADDCHPRSGLSPCIDADNLWPHAGGGPFFAIGSTRTSPAGTLSFGLVGSFLSQPIGARVASPDPSGATIFLVDKAFDATLLFGLAMSDRLELTLAAPATLYQNGAGLAGVVAGASPPPRSAVRDMRLGFALGILQRPRVGEDKGPALVLRAEFSAPTGSAGTFARAPSVVATPSLVFDYRVGRWDFAAEATARLRKESTFANAVVGPQVGGALGVSYEAIKDRWLEIGAEAFALAGTSKQTASPFDKSGSAPPLVPAEWIAHVSTARLLGGDLVFVLGGGSSIPFGSRSAITSPQYRLDFAIRYAPTGRDSDGDGVLDRDDKCPNEPEDIDGFQDADGCPDPDNDGDGIPDVRDKCRDEPEDFDGHQDADGCPDKDDDGDGIPDELDKCRNEPEDFDGFQDHDGCPDPDNDGDGIPDARDKCPNMAEDKNGYQDEDGCPEGGPKAEGDAVPNPNPDADQDGIPDAVDKCPNEPETINGVEDEDGCPEPGAKSLVRWEGDRVLSDAPARFTAGKAAPPLALEKELRRMAQLVRGRAPLASVVIEAYADRQGDTSVKAAELAAARAEAVKKIFIASGIPAEVIVAAPGDPMAKRAPSAPAVDVTAIRKKPRPAKSPSPGANPSR